MNSTIQPVYNLFDCELTLKMANQLYRQAEFPSLNLFWKPITADMYANKLANNQSR